MTNKELKSLARQQLKGRWGRAILYSVVLAVIVVPDLIASWYYSESVSYSNSEAVYDIVSNVVSGPILVGISYLWLNFIRNEDEISNVFWGFKKFGKAFVAYLLTTLAIAAGLILLIIPGIILGLMFSQVNYLLADNEDISAIEAMKESARLMKGHKFRYFMLGLSFIGWILLGIITLGIGFLWITPYYSVTLTNFYKEISESEY